MNIPIELHGHKGRLTHVFARTACLPYWKEDELLVNVEFDSPYPGNTVSTAIAIPVKEYSREELLKVVKEEGDKQIAEMLERYHKQSAERTRMAERAEELKAIAEALEAKLEG